MKLYLQQLRVTLGRDSELPVSMTDGQVLLVLAAVVLGILSMGTGWVYGLWTGDLKTGVILFAAGFAAVLIGIHIETMARIKELAHVCDEDCR